MDEQVGRPPRRLRLCVEAAETALTYYPIKPRLWGGYGDGELSLQLLRDFHSWLVGEDEEERKDVLEWKTWGSIEETATKKKDGIEGSYERD